MYRYRAAKSREGEIRALLRRAAGVGGAKGPPPVLWGKVGRVLEAAAKVSPRAALDEVACMELAEAYRGFDAAKKLHKYVGLATWRLDGLRLGFECLRASSPCHPFPHTIAHRHHPPPSIPPP